MNTKFMLFVTLCFCFSTTIEAQDPAQKALQGLMGSKKLEASKIRDVYTFDWVFKTVLKSEKNEPMEMNYLINSKSNEYFGMEMSSKELKGMGKIRMVMDAKEQILTMFMAMNGQKMAQITKLPEQKFNQKEAQPSYKEIGTKTILDFTCYGIEVEDGDYISQIYFTLDAPVNFSAFSAFANNKNGPKGFDPALLQVLKEDALLMQMIATHKKKSKNNFTLTALSLEEEPTELKKSDYQIINMGF